MRACPKCQRQNEDVDFCVACGEYLRWEASTYQKAVPAPPPQPVVEAPPATPVQPIEPARHPAAAPPRHPAAAPPRHPVPAAPPPVPVAQPVAHGGVPAQMDSVVVTVRLPGQDAAGLAHPVCDVEPGGMAVLRASVRNQSGIVDNYDVKLEGIPAEWVTVTPPTLYLVPFGAAGGRYEDEVEIAIQPPRTPEAVARDWPLQIVAVSRAQSSVAGRSHATLRVAPFVDVEATVKPQIATGRRSARFSVDVANRANAPARVGLSAADAENACVFAFEQPSLEVDRGGRAGSACTIRPPKQIIIGRPLERRFEVAVALAGADRPLPARQAVFRQRPWLPYWILPIIALLIPLLIAAILFRPKPTPMVAVPDVVTPVKALPPLDQAFASRRIAESAGLEFAVVNQARSDVPPGSVIDQSPAPPAKVKKSGGKVSAVVAQGTNTVRVPSVIGMTVQEANTVLSGSKLTMGAFTPATIDITKDPILVTTPAAGAEVKEGSAVALLFKAPEVSTSTTPAAVSTVTAPAATLPATSAGAVAPPPVVVPPPVTPPPATTAPPPASTPATTTTAPPQVPALIGLDQASATTTLQNLGLAPKIETAIDVAAAGTVVRSAPAAGTTVQPGSAITIVVSSGFPQVVYENNQGQLVLAEGTNGGGAFPIQPQGASPLKWVRDATFAPDGKTYAYVAANDPADGGGKLFVADITQAASGLEVPMGDDLLTHPAFSPDGKTLAFIRRKAGTDASTGDRDLCFVAIGPPLGAPSCVSNDSLSPTRPTWYPDGRTILVIVAGADPGTSEVQAYTSPTPNAPDAAQWQPQGALTSTFHQAGGAFRVLDVDIAPNVKAASFVANWRNSLGPTELYTAAIKVDPATGQWSFGKPKATGIAACSADWRQDSRELLVVPASDDCAAGGAGLIRTRPAGRDGDQTRLAAPGFVVLGGVYRPLVTAPAPAPTP